MEIMNEFFELNPNIDRDDFKNELLERFVNL